MALVPCRECGKEVSDQAQACPYCGIKTPSGKKHKIRIYITIGIVAVVLGLCAFAYHRFTEAFAINIENPPPKTSTPAPKIQKDVPVKQQIIQKDYKDKIREMLDSGQSVREISKKTGIRLDEVRKIKRDKTKAEK